MPTAEVMPIATDTSSPASHQLPQSAIPRGMTTATLDFYGGTADGSSPYDHNGRVPPGELQQNYNILPHQVRINDMRGRESQFSLNVNGFASVSNRHDAQRVDFQHADQIQRVYYPEVEKLLLEHVPGAQRIAIFDHTIRHGHAESKHPPVSRVHIDQTRTSVDSRVRSVMGTEAEQLMEHRYRLINVWRPLNGPVLRSPLAVADSRSVSETDLVVVEHRYPTRSGETYCMKPSDKTKWWFWSGIGNDERILLQIFDSQDGARCAHAAFEHEATEEWWPLRESIEVRALVFG